MTKKILKIVVQIVVTAIIYTITLWLFGYIFDGISAFDWMLLLQGLIFSIIFVPFSNWMSRRAEKRRT